MTKKTLYVAVTSALLGFTACKKEADHTAFADQKIAVIKSNLDSLVALNKASADSLLLERLDELSQSEEESKIELTYDYYYGLNKFDKVDSLSKWSIERFPNGVQARLAAYQHIFSADSLQNKIDEYDKWIKQFPPENYSFINRDIYNIGIYYLLENSLNQGRTELTDSIKKRFLDHASKVTLLYKTADLYYKNKQINKTRIYLDKTLLEAKKWLKKADIPRESKEEVEFRRNDALRLYGDLLAENDSCEEAIVYFEKYKNEIDFIDPEVNLKYAYCLEATGQKSKAYEQLKEIVKLHDGFAEKNYPRFKSLFLESQGNEHDFAMLEKELQNEMDDKLKDEISENMISEKAPEFSLLTMQGDKISSSDLEGNILIVDFWATWCAPCKASFPAMQQVKNHYDENPNIKFLFVNTMELGLISDIKPKVENLLSSNSYNFDMYFDSKSAKNNYQMAKAFNVHEIPYKFIIDGNGNIRYKIKGYEGNLEIEKKKLIAMIDVVKDSSSDR